MKPKKTSKAAGRWIPGVTDQTLKKLLTRNAKRRLTEFAGKSAPDFIYLQPPCRNDDCPDVPGPQSDPCAGQTWVWQPDIAVHIDLGDRPCPGNATLRRIEAGLRGSLNRFSLPDPDVRATCSGSFMKIMAWGTRVSPSSCSERARQRATIADLTGDYNFGLYFNASLIRKMAAEAFTAMPKIISENGAPSPIGPTHLTGMAVGFVAPNVIKTFIDGYDERPWPDVNFRLTIKDTLGASRLCDSTHSPCGPGRVHQYQSAHSR